MLHRLVPFLVATAPFAALAEPPRVATDIAPVHSLVARVMDGAGAPDLVVPSGASPHDHAMRPSEAGALQDADAVFWIGPALTPWLDDAIATLAADAKAVALLEVEGTRHREAGEEDHAEHGDAGEDHKEDEHAEESDAEHHGAEGEHAEDDHADHDHGGTDPHAWLDPDNAVLWLDVIAATLAEIDPENAVVYAANAEAGRAEIEAVAAEVAARLAPLRGVGYVVAHDAYAHFEDRFDLPSGGAIARGDAAAPSAGRVGALRARVAAEELRCVFSEPQLGDAMVATLVEGTEARTGVLDPLGTELALGTGLYAALLRGMAESFEACLGEE